MRFSGVEPHAGECTATYLLALQNGCHGQRRTPLKNLFQCFEQDARILAALMALEAPPAYIGVLGPQRRTRELLAEATRTNDAQVERRLSQLHAPMGLDLGSESPETIAFSVLAEIQKSLAASTGLPLREVRGRVRV